MIVILEFFWDVRFLVFWVEVVFISCFGLVDSFDFYGWLSCFFKCIVVR